MSKDLARDTSLTTCSQCNNMVSPVPSESILTTLARPHGSGGLKHVLNAT
jgi:hypothetical protein